MEIRVPAAAFASFGRGSSVWVPQVDRGGCRRGISCQREVIALWQSDGPFTAVRIGRGQTYAILNTRYYEDQLFFWWNLVLNTDWRQRLPQFPTRQPSAKPVTIHQQPNDFASWTPRYNRRKTTPRQASHPSNTTAKDLPPDRQTKTKNLAQTDEKGERRRPFSLLPGLGTKGMVCLREYSSLKRLRNV